MKIKKDIMIRGLWDPIWQKFKIICKQNNPPTANHGVKHLIRKTVKQYEKEHGEIKL